MELRLLMRIAVRIAFVVLIAFVGYLYSLSDIGWGGQQDIEQPWLGGALGAFTAILIVILEIQLRKVSTKVLILGSLGLVWGLSVALLVSLSFPKSYLDNGSIRTILNLIFGYIGAVMAASQAKYIDVSKIQLLNPPIEEDKRAKIIDTSVLIDGRIKDIVKTGFIQGHFMVPKFVIKELQSVADSEDDLNRKKRT